VRSESECGTRIAQLEEDWLWVQAELETALAGTE
jgi:hypothetical protein